MAARLRLSLPCAVEDRDASAGEAVSAETPAQCVDCGVPVSPSELGSWWETTGWIERRREQGMKANSVHHKQFTGRARCPSCGQLREAGLNPQQETML